MPDAEALAEARRLLEEHGLPGGLLPDVVATASIEGSAFHVTLDRTVERVVDDVPVWYDKIVHGTLRAGRIDHLKGVKAKKVLWVPVTAITSDGSELIFSVGPMSDRVPRRFFEG